MLIICTEQEKKALEGIVNGFGEDSGFPAVCSEIECKDCILTTSCQQLDTEKVGFKIINESIK